MKTEKLNKSDNSQKINLNVKNLLNFSFGEENNDEVTKDDEMDINIAPIDINQIPKNDQTNFIPNIFQSSDKKLNSLRDFSDNFLAKEVDFLEKKILISKKRNRNNKKIYKIEKNKKNKNSKKPNNKKGRENLDNFDVDRMEVEDDNFFNKENNFFNNMLEDKVDFVTQKLKKINLSK